MTWAQFVSLTVT